jgi:hypothetical protein
MRSSNSVFTLVFGSSICAMATHDTLGLEDRVAHLRETEAELVLQHKSLVQRYACVHIVHILLSAHVAVTFRHLGCFLTRTGMSQEHPAQCTQHCVCCASLLPLPPQARPVGSLG